MIKLHEFTDGHNLTAQVYKIEGNNPYMVLLYRAEDDYNDYIKFNNEQDAEDAAENWVMKK
jgi:hypothetical protein